MDLSQSSTDTTEPVWHGSLIDPSAIAEHALRQAHELADAAKVAAWDTVLRLLDDQEFSWDANSWRPGGSSWYAPLHQAAWHGAPVQVIDQLIARGAWRTLRTAQGQTPQDIALKRGHDATADRLASLRASTVEMDVLMTLDRQLQAVVDARIRPALSVSLRYPQTEVLTEIPRGQRLWFPVPGMVGGFSIQLLRSYLFVESWSRVVGGSGQAHVVTREGSTLVEQGFV